MDRMRLTDGTNNVNFNPQAGYRRPKDYDEDVIIARDGSEWRYAWFHKKSFEISLRDMNKTDADIINAWREGNEELTFYPDYQDTPGTSYSVTIQNAEDPMQMEPAKGWDKSFYGDLILRET